MFNSALDRIKGGLPASTYYRSLMKSIIMIGFFLPFIPTVLVSSVIFYQFRAAYKEGLRAQIQETALRGKRTMDDFLQARLDDVRLIVETRTHDDLGDASVLKELLEGLQRKHGAVFSELGLLDAAGAQMTYAGPLDSPAFNLSPRFLQKVTNAGEAISDITAWRGRSHFTIGVRIEGGDSPSILLAVIEGGAIARLLERVCSAEDGNVSVLNRDGEPQTRSGRPVKPAQGSLADFLGIEDGRDAEISVVQRLNAYGDKNVYATASTNKGDWLLVYQVSSAQAFRGLSRTKKTALATVLFAGLSLAAYAFSLSKKMVRRIESADRKKEKIREQMSQTAKLASIGELAAGIAHEINNPVAIMVEEAGWIDDLLEEEFQQGKNMEEVKRALSQIQTQGKRCKEITHKLLSFARKTDFRVSTFRVETLIADIMAMTAKRACYESIQIDTDLQEGLPDFNLPRTELQQVLLNLFNNALDAMSEAGGRLSIRARLEEGTLILEVADTGPGIPKEDLPRLFDPFFTTKPVGKGTGLGLSICYGIIKRMGGNTRVDTVLGKGSTFRVTIPISRDGRAIATSAVELPGSNQHVERRHG